MSYRLTYAQILELLRNSLLQVNTARDIVRKSGYRPALGLFGELLGRLAYWPAFGFPELSTVHVPYGIETPIPFPSPEPLPSSTNLSADSSYRTIVETSGFYRVQATNNIFIDQDAYPLVMTWRAVARDSGGGFLRAVVMDELYFPARPGSGAWDLVSEMYVRGTAVIQADAGEVLSTELTVTFLNDSGEVADYEDGADAIGSFLLNHLWIEHLGS